MPTQDDPTTSLTGSELAALFDVSERRVRQLAEAGWITRTERGRYSLIQAVRGYIRFWRDALDGQSAKAADTRLRYARTKEIKLRTVERDSRVMDRLEVLEGFDLMTSEVLAGLDGLPKQITRNPRERQRLIAIFHSEKQRLRDRFADIRAGLLSGSAAAGED